jgi:hypothetical protein
MSMSSSQKRLRFDRATVSEEADGQCRVRVTLALGERLFEAEATAFSESPGPLKAAAEATLKAMQEAATDRFTCSLADLDHVNALGKNLIAVLVDVKFEGRDSQVFGSCQTGDSEIDSAVKSALNATNRFFELAMREND